MTATQEAINTYWDRQPCNVRRSTEEKGSLRYFDEVTARRYFVESHIPNFAHFCRWQNKRVFEIGCGIGTDAECFMSHGAVYVGCDPSEASIELASRRRDLNELKGTFIKADALKAMDEIDKADLIYSFGVLHHTPDTEKIIAKARKKLAPQGEMRVMLYAQNSWKSAMIDAGFDQPEAQADCPLAKRYTHDEARALFKDFAHVSIEQTHIFPYVVKDYIKGRYVKQPWFEAMPQAVFDALQKRFGWHLLITARAG